MSIIRELIKNKYLYILALPGFIFLITFGYIPLFAHILAFKDYKLHDGIFGSKWVGFENFEFFFKGPDWLNVTFNTIYLNALFLVVGLGFSVLLAIFLNDIIHQRLKKLLQSFIFLPYFISWMVVYIMLYTVLNTDGIANKMLTFFGLETIGWYQEAALWPFILVLIYVWKFAGYMTIIFLASITAIPADIYESAKIDGATKFRQVIHITLPLLRPIFLVLLLMGIGRIFYGDFGMIYGLIGDNGLLFPTTDVIDTYSYRALRQMGNFSMSSAIVLYQSLMGLVTIVIFNYIVKKVEPDARLF